jgi:hypothetical protein
MVTGGGWAIPAGEKPDWGFGEVEEVPRTVPERGIEVWWPEEGDRWKRGGDGASARLRSTLDDVRRKGEMTSGSHIHLDKYLGDAWRTVRRPRADCPRGRCYNPTP